MAAFWGHGHRGADALIAMFYAVEQHVVRLRQHAAGLAEIGNLGQLAFAVGAVTHPATVLVDLLSRRDLKVFVSTGDGDCCSIGAAHWIHAIRYNMNMTMVLHDNHIYGLTKMQASPTTPIGLKSKTTPRGAYLNALNPLTVTLGVQNVSFVAQAVDWIPELVYEILSAAFHHQGFSFVRVIQRCPEFLPKMLDPWLHDPNRNLLLTHENGVKISPALGKVYKNQRAHDPSDLDRAREIASSEDPIPVGILYRNPDIPCYEETRHSTALRTSELIREGLEAELDKFTVWPQENPGETRRAS